MAALCAFWAAVDAEFAVVCAACAFDAAASAACCAPFARFAAASALDWAAAAADAASTAALSVTATHADPFQRFGVFAPDVVSIHNVVLFCIPEAGIVDWISTSALPDAIPDAVAAFAFAVSAVLCEVAAFAFAVSAVL